VIDEAVAPVVAAVADVTETLEPVIDEAVAPVVAAVADVTETLEPVIDEAVAPVVAAVADVTETLEPVIDEAVAPVIETASELTGTLGDATDPLSGALADAGEVLASGGSVELEELPVVSDITLDDLFSGGGYTDYGLELQVSVESGPDGGAPDATVTASASPTDTDVALATDLDSAGLISGTVETLGVNITSPSISDGLGLRGLGDLWG
jgi:hypothetical protein